MFYALNQNSLTVFMEYLKCYACIRGMNLDYLQVPRTSNIMNYSRNTPFSCRDHKVKRCEFRLMIERFILNSWEGSKKTPKMKSTRMLTSEILKLLFRKGIRV